MLIQTNLYSPPVNLEERALKHLKHWGASFKDGLYLGFSGGKDSLVVKDLLKRAGVPYVTHYHITTCDPPELIQFIRSEYPDVIFDRPATTIWKLIVEKGPPLARKRYCCKILKENHGFGKDRMVVLGIRKNESKNRAKKRREIESCISRNEYIFNPIFEWTEQDVWDYIRYRNLKYCSLYDEGWKRIGCVMCPIGDQIAEAKRWPIYAENYKRAFKRLYQKGIDTGKPFYNWRSGEEMYYWWITGGSNIDPGTLRMFNYEEDSDSFSYEAS
jgi:phosphoadenosine phosphosulfate reductase